MIELPSLEKLLAALRLNGKVIDCQPLAGGVSASMSLATFQFEDNSRQKWVIRQLSYETLSNRPCGLSMEFSLLGILHRHGIPVPLPVYLDDEGFLFGTPTLVLEYLEGDLDFSDRNLPQRIKNLAQVVARLHSINLDEVTVAGVPVLGFSLEKLIGKIPKNPDPYINENALRSTLENHWPPQQRNPDALLHGDIWNGNLLWQGTRLNGIIDWEDAWIGDPLLDVAGIRLDLACEFGMQYADEFTGFYTSFRKIDVSSLPLWDLVASLWFTRFINEDFLDHPGFFDQYNRPDITIDRFRAVTREFSKNAIQKLVSKLVISKLDITG